MFKRSKNNPIIKPNTKKSWESIKTYNPGVVFYDKKYYLFYRAVGENWKSSIGLAVSGDGLRFRKLSRPVICPRKKYEGNGVEDPRVTKIGDKFFLTYTSFDGKLARIKWAVSKDLKNWQKLGLMLNDWDAKKAHSFKVPWDEAQNIVTTIKEWHKAGGLFSEKIDGRFWMIFGDRNLWLAESKDLKTWKSHLKPFIKPRKGNFFDNVHVEMGPPPLKTKKGWLLLYHGINSRIEYKLGYLLLDINNPRRIIKRSEKTIFQPRKPYELSGLVDILPGSFDDLKKLSRKELKEYIEINEKKKMPKIVFCNGAVLRKGKLEIFYGASDSVICQASIKLSKLL